MPSLVDRLARFAQSPQGRRAASTVQRKAQQWASKPENRAKAQRLIEKVGGRGSRRAG